jgi:arsenate reductase
MTAAGRPPSVLFLCVHNAGRSQMAAGWLLQLAGDRVRVMSAGSSPAAQVHPNVVAAMAEVGIDLGERRPQRWSEALLDAADVVVTMGCGDSCPWVPGRRYEDWPVADPAGQDLAAVRRIRDEIRGRVADLLARLLDGSPQPDQAGRRATPRP